MVEVTLHPLLVKRATSGVRTRTAPYRPGMRAMDLLLEDGFREADAEAVLVLLNDAQVEPDAPLNDGDRVEFMVSIQGGDGW